MRSDIKEWCRACEVCFTRRAGSRPHVPLTPIPVSGPWDRVGVDVLQLPRSHNGNRYLIVFIDYLTKWVEAFAAPDQTALTIARLLVEEVVTRHGVPNTLLSDRGANFLSKLMAEVYHLLGVRKLNTAAYHPQSDGLAERFHRTVMDMMAKAGRDRRSWDAKLPYLLFAYRAAMQSSTQVSPFKLLYGRDARLPTTDVLEPQSTPVVGTAEGYLSEFTERMAEAWRSAQDCIQQAQRRQQRQYDKGRVPTQFQEGDIVYVFMPAKTTGKERKLQRPHDGPFKITQLWPTGAEVVSLRHPAGRPVQVALDRLRRCPEELSKEMRQQESEGPGVAQDMPVGPRSAVSDGPAEPPRSVSGNTNYRSRLRPRVRRLMVRTRTFQFNSGEDVTADSGPTHV